MFGLHDRINRNRGLFANPFGKLPGGKVLPGGYKFFDNGANVLVVAHTDTVQPYKWLSADRKYIASPVLDNRIGVFIALSELRHRGIVCDILLTKDEEIGTSTASNFKPKKHYNWIAEFDRGGDDCALYQYMNKETEQAVTEFGFHPVCGSYTDIVEMDSLGVAGFNFGVGYVDYHSNGSYIATEQLDRLIGQFCEFYAENKDRTFLYTPAPAPRREWRAWNEASLLRENNCYVSAQARTDKLGDYSKTAAGTVYRKATYVGAYPEPLKGMLNVCDECQRNVRAVYATKNGNLCAECIEWLADYGEAQKDKGQYSSDDLCYDCCGPADCAVMIDGAVKKLCNSCAKYYEWQLEEQKIDAFDYLGSLGI